MEQIWLVRLNNLLILLNPILCLIARMLAVLVVSSIDERVMPSKRASRSEFQNSEEIGCVAPSGIPPEWRDLLLHD